MPSRNISPVPWVYGLLLVFAVLGGCSTSPPDSAAIEQVELGKSVYAGQCQICHGDAATGTGKIPQAASHGPDGHTWHHADGQLIDIILGRLDYPGRTMPSFAGTLTENEVRGVLAYIKTGWKPEQRAEQEEASENWNAQH